VKEENGPGKMTMLEVRRAARHNLLTCSTIEFDSLIQESTTNKLGGGERGGGEGKVVANTNSVGQLRLLAPNRQAHRL